jgi:hypothetical protein
MKYSTRYCNTKKENIAIPNAKHKQNQKENSKKTKDNKVTNPVEKRVM